jgi:hypothetical protein
MRRLATLILMLALNGLAAAQEGVSCLALSHTHETVCQAGDSYYVGILDSQETSLTPITREQYLAKFQAEQDLTKQIMADRAQQWKQFVHEEVCSPDRIALLSKKARKKYLADNGCN